MLGRWTTDNIIMVYELLHSVKTRHKGWKEVWRLNSKFSKLMTKEWRFLEEMMRTMAFDEGWISWVMRRVTSVSYATLINGQPGPSIIPTRGIRQDDSISPYLYLICVDGLSKLFNEVESSKMIWDVKVARGSLPINHLFFVDNKLIFCRENTIKWEAIQGILDIYEKASG